MGASVGKRIPAVSYPPGRIAPGVAFDPLPQRIRPLRVARQRRVYHASATPRVRPDDLQRRPAAIPAPRPAARRRERCRGDLPFHRYRPLEPSRTLRPSEDPEAVPQGVVAQTPSDVGVAPEPGHLTLRRPRANLPENGVDLEEADQVEPERSGSSVLAPPFEPRQEQQHVTPPHTLQPCRTRRPLAVVAVGEGLELRIRVGRPVPQPLRHIFPQTAAGSVERDQVPVADGVRSFQGPAAPESAGTRTIRPRIRALRTGGPRWPPRWRERCARTYRSEPQRPSRLDDLTSESAASISSSTPPSRSDGLADSKALRGLVAAYASQRPRRVPAHERLALDHRTAEGGDGPAGRRCFRGRRTRCAVARPSWPS